MGDTRAKILEATNELFRRQGFHGTSLKHVREASGATTGSLYHFFPGGKEELGVAVVTSSGAAYGANFSTIAGAAPDPVEAIARFFEGAAIVLETTDFIDPCPIGSVAREVASTNEPLREATHGVFTSWIALATAHFVEAGLREDDAQGLATTVVAALEGGFVLSRAAKSADPLRQVGRRVTDMVSSALSR